LSTGSIHALARASRNKKAAAALALSALVSAGLGALTGHGRAVAALF